MVKTDELKKVSDVFHRNKKTFEIVKVFKLEPIGVCDYKFLPIGGKGRIAIFTTTPTFLKSGLVFFFAIGLILYISRCFVVK